MHHVRKFLDGFTGMLQRIDERQIEHVLDELEAVRTRGGRLFVLGVGGSAANASHAVSDFRKLCQIESYAPTDNVAEFSARANDEGWSTTLANWLRVSRLGPADLVLVLSVGGGDPVRGVSTNLVAALNLARDVGARTAAIASRDGGHAARVAHACVLIPVVDADSITPYAEAAQAVVWHLLVNHPRLRVEEPARP